MRSLALALAAGLLTAASCDQSTTSNAAPSASADMSAPAPVRFGTNSTPPPAPQPTTVASNGLVADVPAGASTDFSTDAGAVLKQAQAKAAADKTAAPATVSAAAPLAGGRIVDRPIPFPAERIAATKQYIAAHYAPHQGTGSTGIEFEPRMIVLHDTEIASLDATIKTFSTTKLPAARADLASAGDVNVCVQYIVDRDGKIYRLMPDTWMARHTIGLNLSAIGVENVAANEQDLQPAQAAADAWLVRYLKQQHPQIGYLIGHYEYGSFRGSALWWETDPKYFTHKSDPGAAFMQAVRAQVADLGLKSAP
jgi:N-acetylmuramoyl-L-alanine amidase